MKAFAMGIKYSKLVELIKEQESRQKNQSPTKSPPQRPILGEKREEKAVIEEQKIAFLSSAELLKGIS